MVYPISHWILVPFCNRYRIALIGLSRSWGIVLQIPLRWLSGFRVPPGLVVPLPTAALRPLYGSEPSPHNKKLKPPLLLLWIHICLHLPLPLHLILSSPLPFWRPWRQMWIHRRKRRGLRFWWWGDGSDPERGHRAAVGNGTTNPGGTRKPDNYLKGSCNTIPQDLDNPLKAILYLLQNRTKIQWLIGSTITT